MWTKQTKMYWSLILHNEQWLKLMSYNDICVVIVEHDRYERKTKEIDIEDERKGSGVQRYWGTR